MQSELCVDFDIRSLNSSLIEDVCFKELELQSPTITQFGNEENFFSHFLTQDFVKAVKAMFFQIKLLKNSFHEKRFGRTQCVK